MVRDQGQVLVVLAPGDLIDADVDQPGQSLRVQLLGGDPLAHRADGAPGDPRERGHGGLVGLGDQPHDQVLEVGGEPGSGAGEVDSLGDHAVFRASQPAALHRQLADPSAQVKMPPPGVDRAGVVPVSGPVGTRRAHQRPASQTQPNDHRAFAGNAARMHVGDGRTLQFQDTVE